MLPDATPAPVSPRGIVKSKTAAFDVPLFTTEADEPAAPVVVEPTQKAFFRSSMTCAAAALPR